MLHRQGQNSKVLITTPDYPPRRGGLSTFTLNIEDVLKEIGVEYDLLVWTGPKELKGLNYQSFSKYDFIFHIHSLSYQLLFPLNYHSKTKNILFFHGSEILFKGRNPFFTAVKKLLRPMALKKFEKSFLNISISDFTLRKLSTQGYKVSYGRDIVVHNAIKIPTEVQFAAPSIEDDTLRFICVARPVPHKNPSDVKKLVMAAAQVTGKKVELYSCFDLEGNSLFTHQSIDGVSNEQLAKLYQKCHFNILLSLDHSTRGFYEGFGLTVLEAGQYGIPSIVSPHGGLPEACHHGRTGWVLPLKEKSFLHFFSHLKNSQYQKVSQRVYDHTKKSHSLDIYKKVFSPFLREGVKSE